MVSFYAHNLKKSLLIVLLLSACPSKNFPPETRKEAEQKPLFIIKTIDPQPFYFELGSQAPVLIPSPSEASLEPFIPWTHSRHISGFLPIRGGGGDKEETLYAVVNRGGILELRNQGRENALYYHRGGEVWENFQIAAFFRYDTRPTALLTNERFFSVEEHAAPHSPLWALWDGSIKPITIPAIKPEDADPWTANSLFLGKDGFWYIRKNLSRQETDYFRTPVLSETGQKTSSEQYQEAASPLDVNSPSVPPLLPWALAEAERVAGKTCIATVVSPDFPAKRLFSGNTALENGEFPMELSGYYRQSAPGKVAMAVILFPDGRGIYCRSDDGFIKDGHFTLPALPGTGSSMEDSGIFVYTGAALLGNDPELFIVAGWEEQKDWNVGAAGFLLLEIIW